MSKVYFEKKIKEYDAIYGTYEKKTPKYMNFQKYTSKDKCKDKCDSYPLGLSYQRNLDLILDTKYGKPYVTGHYNNVYGITFSKKCGFTYNAEKKDKNKILVLKDVEELEKFEKKYAKKDETGFVRNKGIYDWKKISSDFGGIEFQSNATYLFFFQLRGTGYVWNKDLVKSLKCIAKKNKKDKWVEC